MKTATDPRHLRRRNAVKSLFAESFTHQKNLPEIVKNIIKETKKLNKIIEKLPQSDSIEQQRSNTIY